MRKEIITFKVNEREKAAILQAAMKQQVQQSEFIRNAVIEKCGYLEPEEERMHINPEEKVHINLTLDREMLKVLDEKAGSIGIGRASLIKRMIMEKKVISLNMQLNMDGMYKEMSGLMHELIRVNRAAIRLVNAGESGLSAKDSEYVLSTCEDTNKAIADILKNFWKLNIKVRDTAKREINKYLKECEDNGDC